VTLSCVVVELHENLVGEFFTRSSEVDASSRALHAARTIEVEMGGFYELGRREDAERVSRDRQQHPFVALDSSSERLFLHAKVLVH